jgi:hypothetical protein
MNHTWQKQPDDTICAGTIRVKVWICKVCGCVKTLGYYKFSEPDYSRNGQIYTRYIECIDEKAEMLKTID